MNNLEIVKSYFHNDVDNEFIKVEYLTEQGLNAKLLHIEEVLNHMFTIPQQPLPDSKILKKAEELVLSGKV